MPYRLSRGRHKDPGTGTCLMELAALRAGEPWSDRPACVHPVLAAVARGVNDRTSDEGRDQLMSMVPWLTGTVSGTVGAGLAAAARLVRLCTSAALEAGPPIGARHELAAAHRLAWHILRRSGGVVTDPRRPAVRRPAPHIRLAVAALHRAGLLERAYAHAAALQVAQAVAIIADPCGDRDHRDTRDACDARLR